MPAFICTACGTQFPASPAPPPACPICQDERQFVPQSGQAWTTMAALAETRSNAWRRLEPRLLSLITVPAFAIGQRALLLQTRGGNILWDCLTLLDQATIDLLSALGGVSAIAISHPHYYSSMTQWAHTFGCKVHLHAADREWVMRPDPCLSFWEGATLALAPDVTLLRAGGHFAGGTVLHWGADGGALLAGDIVQVLPDGRRASFMRSYPNLIPLPAAAVQAIGACLAPFAFDRVHSAFAERSIVGDGHGAVMRSVASYLAALEGPPPRL